MPVGGYLAWRSTTFGALLPNTALAKAQGLPTSADLTRPAELRGYAGWLLALIAVVCIGAVAARPSRLRTGMVVLLVPLGLAVAAFGLLSPDWMGEYRFATPVWPLAALATVLAGVHLLPQLAIRGRASVVALSAVGVMISASSWFNAAAAFRDHPTAPLCLVAQNSGHEFNAYPRVLQVRDGTLLIPDVGGAALVSDLRVVDLAVLTDVRIAGYYSTGDMVGLRDYVFTELRPTFIHSHGAWSAATGVLADPRLAADYELIGPTPADGSNWVRRAAVADAALLTAARAWAAEVAVPADVAQRETPRASCGAVLVPPQS